MPKRYRGWKNGFVRKFHKTVGKLPVHFIVSRQFSFYHIGRGGEMVEYFEVLDYYSFDVEKAKEIINEILEEAGLDE